MTTVSQIPIGVRTGYATATTCKMALASLTSGSMSVSCNNSSYPVTLSAIGTDRGSGPAQAGYVGSITLTGLSAFTRYNFTATQGSNSVSGSFMTAPSDSSSDFALFFASCDNNTVFGGDPTGFWNHIRSYASSGALPVLGVLFVDDLGYVADLTINDSAGSGHSTTGIAGLTGKVYDYALGYICNLGMLQDTADQYIAWGRDSDRVWCCQNVNQWPQWGDHEFYNDLGWDFPSNWTGIPPGSGGAATAATLFANGKTAWNSFMLPLQPPSIGTLDVSANHWGFTLGPVSIISPDGFTNARGEWNHNNGALVGPPALDGNPPNGTTKPLFGNNQIDDCLNYLNTQSSPFNILGMSYGIRYLSSTVTVSQSGTQHPLYDGPLAEYQRLFTATGNTPKSIMDNPKTNGSSGITVSIHGDYHRAMVCKNHAAAYASNAAEYFYSVYLGTINGADNFAVPGSVISGFDYQSKTLCEYVSNWVSGGHKWHGIRVEVYGSKSPKEMHIILMDELGNEMWHGRWIDGYSMNGTVNPNLVNLYPKKVTGKTKKSHGSF